MLLVADLAELSSYLLWTKKQKRVQIVEGKCSEVKEIYCYLTEMEYFPITVCHKMFFDPYTTAILIFIERAVQSNQPLHSKGTRFCFCICICV